MIRIFGIVLISEDELFEMIHTAVSYLKTECDLRDKEIAALRRSKEVEAK
jgi:hypothetical protein